MASLFCIALDGDAFCRTRHKSPRAAFPRRYFRLRATAVAAGNIRAARGFLPVARVFRARPRPAPAAL